jgi:hypothetical protein
LIRFADPPNTWEQHATFGEREEQIKGKLLALNLRRLPSWIISREQHKARFGIHPDYEPTPMDSPRVMSQSSFPDYRLSTFIDNGRFEIDRWLRMEFLANDFSALISEFTDLTDEARQRAAELGRTNALEYDHEVLNWFTRDQIATLYEKNPTWSSLEKRLYGVTWADL